MQSKKLRRLLAGASTVAMTAGIAASFGVGAASAAPVSQSTTAGQWPFLRTVQASIADTTTTLTAPATATNGAPVDLVATVSPAPDGGTVQFMDGVDNIGAPVAVIGGTATLSQAFTTVGAHQVSAVYSGAAGFNGSTSAAATVTVSDPAPVDVATTTTLSAPATATTGASVNLTATISPAPTGGTVQFLDGGIPIGAPVNVTGGKATLSQAFATEGSHSITASFSGAPGFAASAAPAATVAVTVPAPPKVTTTTLTAPVNVVPADGVTLSVVVDPAPTGNGGTVQFFDGTTPLGTAVPVTNGRATITIYRFVESPPSGPHSVTAKYSGTSGYLGSTSEAKVVTVTSSGTPPTFGSS